MDDILLAKGLLIGHNDKLVRDFIVERVTQISTDFRRDNTTIIHGEFSDILLELYQKTGLDLNYDNLEIHNGELSVDLRYYDDFKTFNINIGVQQW